LSIVIDSATVAATANSRLNAPSVWKPGVIDVLDAVSVSETISSYVHGPSDLTTTSAAQTTANAASSQGRSAGGRDSSC
jgi:hypothetical protein